MLKTVSIPGARLSVYDQGEGPPLLFAHGFPLDHRMWHSQLTALAVSHRVIAPDLRGFGDSHAPLDELPPVLGMEQFAHDCAAVLDALEVREPVVFCGQSMGGYIAWPFVQLHRARLRGLVLCDTRAVADDAEMAATRRRQAALVLEHGMEILVQAMSLRLMWQGAEYKNPDLEPEVRAMIHAAQPRAAAATLYGLAERPDVTARLGSIDVPALVLVGVHDTISPPHEMHALAQAIPGAEYRLVEEAGHLAPLENPAAVNTAMIEFLAGLPA